MIKILIAIFLVSSIATNAQDDNCIDRILAKNGTWKKITSTNRATPADYAVQSKFISAVHSMSNSYQPRGVQPEWYSTHSSKQQDEPVAGYMYHVLAMRYSCDGAELKLNHETNTKFTVKFNTDFSRMLFQENIDYTGTNFNVLREGFPEEVQPGVWKFKDVKTSLGFGNEGLTKLWLITYPGQLPWNYVTRREFLQKRRSNLLRMIKEEEERLQANLSDLEKQKKNIQQILKDDAAKYASYIKNDYEPAPKRFRDLYDKSVEGYNKALKKVNDQLEAPETELNKNAVVLKSTSNHLDYDFVKWPAQGAEILTKPNPAYFKKGVGPSVPQMIEAGIQYFQQDRISSTFASEIEKKVDVGYLQTLIGKSAPPAFNQSGNPKLKL
ncbi:MAG: hypothetical protein ACXWV4_11550 [Flavitalea sp.]